MPCEKPIIAFYAHCLYLCLSFVTVNQFHVFHPQRIILLRTDMSYSIKKCVHTKPNVGLQWDIMRSITKKIVKTHISIHVNEDFTNTKESREGIDPHRPYIAFD